MFQLTKKKAVVTGGGSGIGKAICKILSQQGAIVYVLDINKEEALQTVVEIEQQKGSAIAEAIDVTNQETTNKVFDQKTGTITIINGEHYYNQTYGGKQ